MFGKIAIYGHCYGIVGHKECSVVKNSIYEKCLPKDTVEFDITNNQITIRQITERTPQKTIAVIRGIRDRSAFLCLPLVTGIFNHEIQIPDETIYRIGDMWECEITINSFTLGESLGNAFSCLSVKKYINQIINEVPEDFKEFYRKNLPIRTNSSLYSSERKDLSHLNTFNVDPQNSKDWDDCVSIDWETKKFYVHIVDICANLPLGSEEDIKAAYQGFTLYLPDMTGPCLPRPMSEELFSLKVNERRNVITFEFSIDEKTLNIQEPLVYPSEIVNKTFYSYEEFDIVLKEWSTSDDKSWFIDFLKRWQVRNIDVPYLRLMMKKGRVEAIRLEGKEEFSYKFIETLMIATNIAVANMISRSGRLFPQRWHPKSLVENPNLPTTDNQIVNNYIKLLSFNRATYSVVNNGHFGIGASNYTHFTSPIRRQIDTINHRIMAGYEYDDEFLTKLVEHMEKHENFIEKISTWYYDLNFKKYLRNTWTDPVEAYVTSVYTHGVDFLVPEWMLDGYVHVSKLPNLGERWFHNQGILSASGQRITVGTKLKIYHEGIGIVNIKFVALSIV